MGKPVEKSINGVLNKRCPSCKNWFPVSLEFWNKATGKRHDIGAWCKTCSTTKTMKSRKKHIEHYKEYQKDKYWQRRNWQLKHRFGITIEDFEEMLVAQHFRCAICGKHQKDYPQNFDVDHNHKTGHVRGLLCRYCNRMLLRTFRDNKQIAIGLRDYMDKALNEDKVWK